MDDFPIKLADLLEGFAGKARALTVDRVAQWTKMAALGMVVATLGLLAVLFLVLSKVVQGRRQLRNDGTEGDSGAGSDPWNAS